MTAEQSVVVVKKTTSTKLQCQTSTDEILTASIQQLKQKFPGDQNAVVEYYVHHFFPRLPPIPYGIVLNDAFFAFLGTSSANSPNEHEALNWLKKPDFETGMAAFAKLPDKPYLSGFHPFAFQHDPPATLDTKHFDRLQAQQTNTMRIAACEDYKKKFKEITGSKELQECPQCKEKKLCETEKRTRLGADEAATPIKKCLNCSYEKKL